MNEIDLIDWDDLGYKRNCRFSGVTIGPNEAVRIEVDPAKTDVNGIIYVEFKGSSIHSIPREIFTKFPNLKTLQASGQNIQEITADNSRDGKHLVYIYLAENAITFLHKDTFANAGKLRVIDLSDNALTFLHKDTFDGEYSHLSSSNSSQLKPKRKECAIVESKTVKIQILRIRFLRYSESNSCNYSENLGDCN
jgi:hypothetical protein